MIIKNGKVFQKDGSYKVTDLYAVSYTHLTLPTT